MKMKSGYWNLSEFKVTYTNGTTVTADLDPRFVAPTPFRFSYHCSDPDPVKPFNSTTHGISVRFTDLQVSKLLNYLH